MLGFWEQSSVSGRIQCTLAAQPKSGEDTMTKEESVKETPKEIFLKDYKAPDYAFEKVFFNGTFKPEHNCFCTLLPMLKHKYVCVLAHFISASDSLAVGICISTHKVCIHIWLMPKIIKEGLL